MLLESFIQCIKDDLDRSFSIWNIQITKEWHKCCAQIGGSDQAVLWIKNPNKDGSFWVFISAPLSRVAMIPGINVCHHTKTDGRYRVSLENQSAKPMELLDRESTKPGSWERNWPVGFKLADMNQFELARRIVICQWT